VRMDAMELTKDSVLALPKCPSSTDKGLALPCLHRALYTRTERERDRETERERESERHRETETERERERDSGRNARTHTYKPESARAHMCLCVCVCVCVRVSLANDLRLRSLAETFQRVSTVSNGYCIFENHILSTFAKKKTTP
jgi:hypothetical protein